MILEQLEDPIRLRTPGAEAKPDTGDVDLLQTALHRSETARRSSQT